MPEQGSDGLGPVDKSNDGASEDAELAAAGDAAADVTGDSDTSADECVGADASDVVDGAADGGDAVEGAADGGDAVDGTAVDDGIDTSTVDEDVARSLRSHLDGLVDNSHAIAAAEAARLRGTYAMLQESLDNPGIFIPNATGLTRADLRGEAVGWVRSSLAQEIGAALGLTKGHAAGLISDAEALCETLPATLDALEVGDITRQHANSMIRNTVGLDDDAIAAFEAEALPKAVGQSPTQFGRAAIKIREGLFPETITQRRQDAAKDRRVECYGTHDGMGALVVHASMEVVQSLHNAARHTARALKAAGDVRTLTQIEADALIDAVMIGYTQNTGQHPGVGAAGTGLDRVGNIRPSVHVTVPVMTLLGKTDEPGNLDGYGPIAPGVARKLAAQAPSFTRLLTHPETGAVLSVGRDSYKVPADLKRAVNLRDETCTGIGCDRSATMCDLDHVQEWQNGGETRLSNVTAECEQHHMIRHHTTWQIRLTDDNETEWTSPLGYSYRVPRTSNVQFAEATDNDGGDSDREDARAASATKEYPDTPHF